MAKIIINESDHEKTIKVNVGDEIEIILANNEAVKHYWGIGGGEILSMTGPVLMFNNDKAAQITIKEGRVGGFGGTSMFPFTVASTGKTIVELLLKASGEPEEAAHDHFRVTIIAEEPLKPASKNMTKHKYWFMRWEGKPGTKYEEILVDGKLFTIETDKENIR